MSEFKVNDRDMKLLSNGKLILQNWYLFLKAIDTIQYPTKNRTFAPFKDIWRDDDYGRVPKGMPEIPSEHNEKTHSANRPGGTGEMYYFSLELQRFVEDIYLNHPHKMLDYAQWKRLAERENPDIGRIKDALQEKATNNHDLGLLIDPSDKMQDWFPLLWDRPGWYIEVVQTRRPEEEIDGNDVPPWPHIILGYASNAADSRAEPEWTRKRPYEDFCSVHVLSIDYKADQTMTYRLMWEQIGRDAEPQRMAENYEDSWAVPTENNVSTGSFIPITRPIRYLFKKGSTTGILNYPYVGGMDA